MVFQKQLNEEGNYIGQDGKRYEILSCNVTESKEWYDAGEVDAEGNPIMAQRVVINKGWDAFENLEQAAQAYGLIYDPIEQDEELDKIEDFD